MFWTSPSLPFGEDRTTVTFNFFMEGSAWLFALTFQKKKKYWFVKTFGRKASITNQGAWNCSSAIFLWSLSLLTQTHRLACREMRKTKLRSCFFSAVWFILLHAKWVCNQASLSVTPQHFIWNRNSRVLIQVFCWNHTPPMCSPLHGKMKSSLTS